MFVWMGHMSGKGFTLIEILIVVILITVAGLSLIWALSAGLLASGDIENIENALKIAQAKMEEVKNTPFVSLADSGSSPDPVFPKFSTAVDVAEGQDPMLVDVTVSWSAQGTQDALTLTTLMTDY